MAEARQRALLRFRLVPLAVSALAERRIDARPLLARFGVSEAPLGEPIYVSLAKVTAFLDECAKLAGDPVFGWNLAKRAPLGVYGLVEFAMRSAGTLREGFEAVRRYGALINGLFEFEIDEAGDELGFGFTIHGVRAAGGVHLNEYTMQYALRMVSSFTRDDSALRRLELAHDRREPSPVASQLAIPVTFGARACRMWIAQRVLDARSPLSDPGLYRFLEQQILASLAADGRDDIVRAVRDALVSRIGHDTLDVRDIARQLGLSERTLQRRLLDAGTSYRDVVDLVRQQRAKELVLIDTLSIAEISARVGYDDPVAFTRAFRRWTGRSPREHRKLGTVTGPG